jgi:hypothetical protein
MTMTKFESNEDPDFALVFSEIRRWASDTRARHSTSPAFQVYSIATDSGSPRSPAGDDH